MEGGPFAPEIALDPDPRAAAAFPAAPAPRNPGFRADLCSAASLPPAGAVFGKAEFHFRRATPALNSPSTRAEYASGGVAVTVAFGNRIISRRSWVFGGWVSWEGRGGGVATCGADLIADGVHIANIFSQWSVKLPIFICLCASAIMFGYVDK